MNAIPTRLRTGEDGTALILTLAFLSFVGLIVGALLNLTSVNVIATNKFQAIRSTHYDADAAMESFIATLRVDRTRGYYNACTSLTFASLNSGGSDMRVDCTAKLMPIYQREVFLSVCPASMTTTPCPDSQSLLQAHVVLYDDVAFGRAAIIKSWSANG